MFGIHHGPRGGHPHHPHRHPEDRGPEPGPGPGHRGRGGPRRGPGGPGGFGGFGGRPDWLDAGGPRGGPGGRRRRGDRRARGDVRLAVLALLGEAPMHGYQLIQEIAERSGGSWRPSPGSIYPTVSQLADEGLVHTEKAEGRTVVHLTDEGRRYAEEHRTELDGVWASVGTEDGLDALRTAGAGLMGAAVQVAEVGTTGQVADAVRLLEESRRRLYLLLAGESGDTPDPSSG